MAEHLIEGVRDVDGAQMSVAIEAVIVGSNGVRLHQADGGRAREKIVVVELERGIVFVVVEIDFHGVAGCEEILAVHIRDHHLLMPVAEGIQPAVGILFKHREISQVVLIAVRVERAEEPQAGLLVGKNETAEIAVEGLDSGARGNKIEIATEVRQLYFDESFLQSNVAVEPRTPLRTSTLTMPFSCTLR